jgi:hypothetical protein
MGERHEAAIAETTTIQRGPRAVHRELSDGAAVLLHLDSGAYYSLNEVGVLIWKLLENGRTFASLVEQVRARIVDAPPELPDDVREFLGALNERNLVEFENRVHDE